MCQVLHHYHFSTFNRSRFQFLEVTLPKTVPDATAKNGVRFRLFLDATGRNEPMAL
jgi:hypothetical protein